MSLRRAGTVGLRRAGTVGLRRAATVGLRRAGTVGLRRARTVSLRSSQRGSVTVLMLAVIGAALLLAMMLAAVGRATNTHAQAQGIADLAALAAARQLADSGAPPCPVAQQVATGHGAHLAQCRVEGLMVQVEVLVDIRPLPGWHTAARAAARAGPVGQVGTG